MTLDFIRLFILVISLSLFSTSNQGQASMNMTYMAELDLETAGNRTHSDMWGYKWKGKEYAVVGGNSGIYIVDVSDCANPILEHTVTDNAFSSSSSPSWRDFKDYKGYVYGVCDVCNGIMHVINKDTYETFAYEDKPGPVGSHNIFIDKTTGRLYAVNDASFTGHNGVCMWVYDLNIDPEDPPLIASIDFNDWDDVSGTQDWYVHDVYVRNDTAFCSHGYSGHAVWDMGDLTDINLIGSRDGDGGYNHSSWVHDELPYEYVAREVPNGLDMEVYDNSDFSDIEIAKSFSHSIYASTATTSNKKSRYHNPFVHQDRLFASNYSDGVKVFDLSDPVNPTILGYYDTYDVNNNNYGNNNNWEGCWGIYPFLPSGCILASDQTKGLMTLKMLVAPNVDVVADNADVVFSKVGTEIYFSATDKTIWKMEINNSGSLVQTLVTSTETIETEAINMNLNIRKTGGYLYMRNSSGQYYRIRMDNGGALSAPNLVLEANLPTDAVYFHDQSLYLSQYGAGIEFVNSLNNCYRLSIEPGGVRTIKSIACD